MNPQPPSDPDNVAPSEAPREGEAVEQSKDAAKRRSWRPPLALVVAVVVAGVVTGALIFTGDDDQPKEQAAPEEALACPYLQMAAVAYNTGDKAAFEAAIEDAMKVARRTLQESGQLFGKPERIALELGLDKPIDPGRLLGRAQAACSERSDSTSG